MSGKVTIYWDKAIKTDKKVNYNRPDMVVVDREEHMWYIVDFAIPVDLHVNPNLVEGGVIYVIAIFQFTASLEQSGSWILEA